MRNIITIFIFLVTSSTIRGQETPVTNHDLDLYYQGLEYYQNKLYNPASNTMQAFLDQNIHHVDEVYQQYALNARRIIHQSALILNLPQAEKDLADFVGANSTDPIILESSIHLGTYYYNEKKYEKAIEYFDKVDIENLKDEEFSEVCFKKGYSHFVLRQFGEAQSLLRKTKDIRNIYYYPVNYYYGMCAYFGDDYITAVNSFERVSNSSAYSPFIPYYITQIYFSQDEFEKLITYGEQALRQQRLEKRKEIRLLLGQAYFKNDLYIKALPNLEYYESNTTKLTQEEFYQLAFSHYQLKNYEDAIEYFKELTLLDSKLGQLVNYYLADCFTKTGDMNSARTAFKKVSQMNYETSMAEEALFNYGKLSAELNYDREGINSLVKVRPFSLYYAEARKIINDILLNSGDYPNSISIIESLEDLTDDLKATYQIVTFNRAIQLLDEGNFGESRIHFAKADKYQIDQDKFIISRFWLAYMLNREGRYQESMMAYDQYFDLANGKGPFPDESSPYTGHYIQGYNHLKLGDYARAEFHFKNSIVGVNLNREEIENKYVKDRILPDALLRAGDCLFKQNLYEEAELFYNQSIDRKTAGYLYAMYQKGLIQGLMGKPYDKILTLEELVNTNPLSEYADDALFQLGDTYLALGNTGPALLSFNRIVEYYQGKSTFINSAYLKLGLISYNQGDSDAAVGYYVKVFDNNPNSKETQEAIIALEEIYIDDQGKSDEYFALLDSIPGIEVTAFNRDSLTYQIGQSQYEDGEYETAVESFDNYLDKYPAGYYRLEARYYRGECNSILKRYRSALRDYEYLIQQGYNDHYIKSLRKAAIISYNFTQNFNKAYSYYNTLAEESRDEEEVFEAQMGAMRSSFRTTNYGGVKKYARKVIASSLASYEDFSTAYYYLGKASYNTEEMDQALLAFDKINKNRNNQAAEANYLISKIFFGRGDIDLAEQQINFTLENSENYPYWIAQSLILYGDVYLNKGDLFNARAVIEAVIENYDGNEDIIAKANEKLQIIETRELEENRVKSGEGAQLEMDTTGNGN
jgi:tetratricopeptide (TPR) repeat protein